MKNTILSSLALISVIAAVGCARPMPSQLLVYGESNANDGDAAFGAGFLLEGQGADCEPITSFTALLNDVPIDDVTIDGCGATGFLPIARPTDAVVHAALQVNGASVDASALLPPAQLCVRDNLVTRDAPLALGYSGPREATDRVEMTASASDGPDARFSVPLADALAIPASDLPTGKVSLHGESATAASVTACDGVSDCDALDYAIVDATLFVTAQ